MIIKGIKYDRYPDMPREWRIVGKDDDKNEDYAYFGNLNLLIGKNATGKSRTIRAIRDLSDLICGRLLIKDVVYHTQRFDFLFEDEGQEYRYVLHFKEKEVLEETLYIDNTVVLDRNQGFIISLGEKKDFSNKLDKDELLICKKKGSSDFYFQSLVVWAISLRSFMFSDQFEKNKYIEDLYNIKEDDLHSENLEIIVPMFHWSREQFGQKFEDEILDCMNLLGYNLTDIAIKEKSEGYYISVEEDGKYSVSQQEMSHGMFRALALFVILINARWRDLSVCILVDDIAEGLDHERSKEVINTVINKTFNTHIQYFISTNDRYVMNQINLKYWSIIDKETVSKSVFYNIHNSKPNFDDFRYTGLNNFDFFTTDFYRDGFGEDDNDNEEN